MLRFDYCNKINSRRHWKEDEKIHDDSCGSQCPKLFEREERFGIIVSPLVRCNILKADVSEAPLNGRVTQKLSIAVHEL